MATLLCCCNSDCVKSSECYRFLVEKDESEKVINYQEICRESNNYKWFWQAERKESESNV